jgi:hypothetical protein
MVPPILLLAVISLSALRRPLLACRVLPGLTVAAAMRASGVVRTWGRKRYAPTPTDEPAPRTLLPWPAQSPGRRHRCRRRCALAAPFHPLPVDNRRAGLLSVAGLRRAQLTPRAPPLAVSRGGLPKEFAQFYRTGSREVPLEVRSSDGPSSAPVLQTIIPCRHPVGCRCCVRICCCLLHFIAAPPSFRSHVACDLRATKAYHHKQRPVGAA